MKGNHASLQFYDFWNPIFSLITTNSGSDESDSDLAVQRSKKTDKSIN